MSQLTLPPADGLVEISCTCTVPPTWDIEVGGTRYIGAGLEVEERVEDHWEWRKPYGRTEAQVALAEGRRARIYTWRTFNQAEARYVEVAASAVTLLPLRGAR